MTLARLARVCTLLITYVTKLVGLASAFNQLLLQPHPNSLALAVSAFMIAGGQLTEGMLLSALDRLLSIGEEDEHHVLQRPRDPPARTSRKRKR